MRRYMGSMLSVLGMVIFASQAFGQIYAVTVNGNGIYEIDPDVPSIDKVANNPSNFVSAGNAFDGRYHYSEKYPGGGTIAKVDLTGPEATKVYERDHTLNDGGNYCLTVSADGTLWEIDRGTSLLYTLVFDDSVTPPTVSRVLHADLGDPALVQFGDIAWGPDGLLYIATNNATLGNSTWDPVSGDRAEFGNTGHYNGITWYAGKLYGSKTVSGLGDLWQLDPTDMSMLGTAILSGVARLNDLGAWPLGATYDLCAGQSMDAGDVVVWHDCDNLYVQFLTDGSWWMSETHLHVAFNSSDDIPQTKKGNPRPGQFDYQREYDPRVTEDLYVIPIEGDGTYYIAAHAVVIDQEMVISGNTSFHSGPGVDVYGPSDSYLGLGDPGWGDAIPAVATWEHGAWPWQEGTWISTSYLIGEDGGSVPDSSWRWFHEEFELPYSAFNIWGTATATADNAEEVYLNGGLVGSDGEVQGAWVDNREWDTVLEYNLVTYLQPGVNQLDFIVRNYPGSSNPYSNPTGLIYEVTVDFQYDGNEETAWGDGCEGTSFPGNNWGTYFMFDVVGCD